MKANHRCDNCGRKARRRYCLGHFAGRSQWVCADCLERVVRGINHAERAVRSFRRAA